LFRKTRLQASAGIAGQTNPAPSRQHLDAGPAQRGKKEDVVYETEAAEPRFPVAQDDFEDTIAPVQQHSAERGPLFDAVTRRKCVLIPADDFAPRPLREPAQNPPLPS
jgi:hypothetical protein